MQFDLARMVYELFLAYLKHCFCIRPTVVEVCIAHHFHLCTFMGHHNCVKAVGAWIHLTVFEMAFIPSCTQYYSVLCNFCIFMYWKAGIHSNNYQFCKCYAVYCLRTVHYKTCIFQYQCNYFSYSLSVYRCISGVFFSKERLRSTVFEWKDKPVVHCLVDAIQNFYPFAVGST